MSTLPLVSLVAGHLAGASNPVVYSITVVSVAENGPQKLRYEAKQNKIKIK
jgi:hypothetical protein